MPRDPLASLSLAEVHRRLRAITAIHPGRRTQRDRRMIWRLTDQKNRRRKGA